MIAPDLHAGTVRTYVITGGTSGIGKATAELLAERGHRVIGVGTRGGEVVADLSTAGGRALLVERVSELTGGAIDAIIANAGTGLETAASVALNYFGAVATLEGLRPLLVSSSAARAVAITSMAALLPPDDELLAMLLDGDEPAALARAKRLAEGTPDEAARIYPTTKRALSRWIRRSAPTAVWAGARIPLNAVAPGVVKTPLTTAMTASAESRRAVLDIVPMPLNGIAEPLDVAYLLGWLTSEENSHLCGQVIYVDGGADALIRGDLTW